MRKKLKPNIFLPIEVKPREFTAKVLIGAEAAKKGSRVYIGAKPGVNLVASRVQGGAYLYKDMTLVSLMSKIKANQHAFVVLDEEMSPADDEIELTYRARFREENAKYVDKILLLSDAQIEPLRKCSEVLASKAVVTGWARTDLWRNELRVIYATKANEIRKRYGEFVLVASDFGVTSQVTLEQFVAHVKCTEATEADKNLAIERWHQMFDSFKDFSQALKSILTSYSENMPHIVLRPHPGDDHEGWRREFAGLKNIDIVYQGDISEWLDASLGLIHRGCTTAIEAVVTNKPTAYYQGASTFIRDALPRQISKILKDEDQLYDFLKNIKKPQVSNDDIKKNIDKQIFFHRDFSYKRIATELMSFDLTKTEPARISIKERLSGVYFGPAKNFFLSKSEKWNKHVAPNSQKRPGGIKASEIRQLISNLPEFKGIKVTDIHKDLVLMEL